MPTKKPKTTITIEPHVAEALEKLAAIKGYSDRDALAQSILQGYLHPAIDRCIFETFPGRVITASEIEILSGVENYLLRVRFIEHGMPSQVRKSLEIQTVSSGPDEQERIKTPFRFPLAQIARARTVLLPWLDQTFADAEAAHKEQVQQNQLASQEERKARTPEQVAHEADTRKQFTAVYGKELWSYAVDQAARHRARRRDLAENFTAAAWLTLADRQGFACADCRKPHEAEHLQSHHIRALMHEGTNAISNIVLLWAPAHETEKIVRLGFCPLI